jgi:hypothetical protein
VGHLFRNSSLSADLNQHLSVAGAVEFTEENSLPGAEDQGFVFYENLFAAANYRALGVCIGITFGMTIARPAVGYEFLERQENIMRNGRIGIFVYSDSGGRVRTMYDYVAIANIRLSND